MHAHPRRPRAPLAFIALLAVLITAGLMGGSARAQAPPAYTVGQSRVLVQDIQRYWALMMPRVYGRRFMRVPSARIRGVSPRTVGSVACREGLSWRDIQGNAIGGVCSEGPMVMWDGTPSGIVAQMRARFGPTPVALMFAHEFGHIVQAELGIDRSSVLMEQQADCFGGAYIAWNRTNGVVRVINTPADTDQLVRGMLLLRDAPGSSAQAADAHGSGFDRVRAFQDGLLGGLKACRAYTTRLPRLFETTFRDSDPENGNMAYDDLLALIPGSLNDHFAGDEPGFTALTLGDAANAPQPNTCSTTVPWALSCADTRTILLRTADVRGLNRRVGDGATVALLAMAWADANVPAEVGAQYRYAWDACRAGNFFRGAASGAGDSALSPGDLDEVLALLLQARPGVEAGQPTLASLAFRNGFFGARETCRRFTGALAS